MLPLGKGPVVVKFQSVPFWVARDFLIWTPHNVGLPVGLSCKQGEHLLPYK